MGFIYFDLKIPIVRQLIGFLYLTFIPGIMILRIVKPKVGNIESLLYTIGLSLSSLILIGLLLNYLQNFGIIRPISIVPLIIILTMFVLVLCLAGITKNKKCDDLNYIDIDYRDLLKILLLILVPFLSIFGTYVVNFYQDNSLLELMMIIIALVVILVNFNFIPTKLYQLTIFIVSITLLFHNSLISMYLWGWDIQIEYYFSDLVIKNAYWNSSIYNNVNSVLSIVVIAPIYSIIGNIDIIWIFKIIYPFIFSLVPVGLYHVFKELTNEKIAFLSCYFFITVFPFFTELLNLARQEIAEFFLILMMLSFFNKNIDNNKRSGLLLIFIFSFIVSHYGLSYIFMFIIISIWLLFRLNIVVDDNRIIKTRFVQLYVIIAIAWYLYVSNSSVLDNLFNLGNKIADSISADFLKTESTSTGIVLNSAISPMREIAKYLHIITQFFIIIGILASIKLKNIKGEYAAFSYMNCMILIIGLAVPYFASALNTTRLYHITLIFLAPFCIIGGKLLLENFNKILKIWNKNSEIPLKLLSIYFAIFMLFNTGLVLQLANEPAASISLNSSFDYPRFDDQEIAGGKWLQDRRNENIIIYSDSYRGLLVQGLTGEKNLLFGTIEKNLSITQQTYLPKKFYLFFGRENIKGNIVFMTNHGSRSSNLQDSRLNSTLPNYYKIYDNGGSYIYHK